MYGKRKFIIVTILIIIIFLLFIPNMSNATEKIDNLNLVDVEPLRPEGYYLEGIMRFINKSAIFVGILNIIVVLINNKKINKKFLYLILTIIIILFNYRYAVRLSFCGSLGYNLDIADYIAIITMAIQIMIFIYLIVTVIKQKRREKENVKNRK